MAFVIPKAETAEGIIQELDKQDLENVHFFWPHSALSRPVLSEYFTLKNHPFDEIVLYDTLPQKPGPLPSEEAFDQIIFTSPSTVDAFLKLFGKFPEGKVLKAIGPVTAKYLTGKTCGLLSPTAR